MTRTFTSRLTSFQPTRPRGARPQAHARDVDVAVVSTHTPARGATSRASQGRSRSSSFNPRAARGAILHICHIGQTLRFQPTRPRGARRFEPTQTPNGVIVSTHTPARGATGAQRVVAGVEGVSTHAPARGATSALHATSVVPLPVSTHAPARGATCPPCTRTLRPPGFNPRAREGRD